MSSPASLRSRLIGAWQLESYIAYPTIPTDARPFHPMTKSVTGIIMYTPDGYMSAQMLIPGQTSFTAGEATDMQWAEAGRRYLAYSGPFFVTEEGGKEVLRHQMQVSNRPSWLGETQVRGWVFEEGGSLLVLGTGEDEIQIQGKTCRPELKWRRMDDNSSGVLPETSAVPPQ